VLTKYIAEFGSAFVIRERNEHETYVASTGVTKTDESNRHIKFLSFKVLYMWTEGDRSSTVVKVLCYKLEGRWFDPNWCQWIFL